MLGSPVRHLNPGPVTLLGTVNTLGPGGRLAKRSALRDSGPGGHALFFRVGLSPNATMSENILESLLVI